MRGLRHIWRSLRDTFDHLIGFIFGTVMWWILGVVPLALIFPLGASVGTIVGDVIIVIGLSVFAAPVTVVLMRWTDPRRTVNRPDVRDFFSWYIELYRRSLVVGLLVFGTIGVLILNIVFYAGSTGGFGLLLPLWLALLVITIAIGLAAFSIAGAEAPGAINLRGIFRRAGYVTATGPFQSAWTLVLMTLTGLLLAILVVPFALLGPSVICAIVNRLVLTQLGIAIPDPNAPTDERVTERSSGKGRRR